MCVYVQVQILLEFLGGSPGNPFSCQPSDKCLEPITQLGGCPISPF